MSFFISKDLEGRVTESSLLENKEINKLNSFLLYLESNNSIIEILSYNCIDKSFTLKLDNHNSYEIIANLIESNDNCCINMRDKQLFNLKGSQLFLVNFENINNNYIKLKLKIKQN